MLIQPGAWFRNLRLFSAVAGLAAFLPAGPATGQPTFIRIEDRRVAPEDFAIFPWDQLGSRARFEEAKECGMNLAGFVPVDLLDDAHAAGLKGFVSDPRIMIRGGEDFSDDEITSRVEAVVRDAGSHPAVFGYHLLDEPKADLFPVIARWVKAFHAAAPGAVAYTNLFPDYGKSPGPGGPFESYLRSFVETVRPKAFSYDHYALFEDGKLREAYFPNLEAARKVSLETQTPFWHVVLANAHFHYAEPSDAGFRFQVYTSLAYGARGIGWFTYSARERGNYRSSAIDAYGRKTATWGMLRDANLQAHRLAPVLTKMKSVGVFHHPKAPEGSQGLDSSRFLKGMGDDGSYVVGEFEGEAGQRAVLVVNKSLTRSARFAVDPREAATIRKVSSTTGETLPMTAENDWLAPGQGMLLLLDQPAAK